MDQASFEGVSLAMKSLFRIIQVHVDLEIVETTDVKRVTNQAGALHRLVDDVKSGSIFFAKDPACDLPGRLFRMLIRY